MIKLAAFKNHVRIVRLPLVASVSVWPLSGLAGGLSISGFSVTNGNPQLAIQGDLGQVIQIQFKTNLGPSSWAVVANLPLTYNPGIFIDTNALPSAGFYSVTSLGAAPAYFVDSVNGNDGNDGLTPATAFQSVMRLEQADATNHQSVWNFARGSVWREQCTIYANSMLLQAYGAGERPLFDASGVMTNARFEKSVGWTNTYQMTVGISNVEGSPQWINCYENGFNLPRAGSMTSCDMTPGSYWVTNDNCFPSLTTTIWINPANNSNPITDGNDYEFTQRQDGIFSGRGTNVTIIGLATRRNLHNDGSLKVVDYSAVIDCAANDGGKHNLFIGGNSYAANCFATNAYYPGGCAMFIGNNATTGTVTFSNCCAISTIAYGSTWHQMGGFYAHTAGAPGVEFGLISEIGCTSFGLGNSFAGWATNMVVEGCTGDGAVDLASTNAFIRDTRITTTNNQALNCTGGCLILAVSNCSLVCSAEYGQAAFMPGVRSFTSTNSVYSATNQGWGLLEQSSSVVTNWETYSNSIAAYWDYYVLTENPTSFLSDSNAFTSPNGASCEMQIDKTNYSSFSGYSAALSADAHSIHP